MSSKSYQGLLWAIALVGLSCGTRSIDADDKSTVVEYYYEQGAHVALTAQQALLAEVSAAMSAGGPVYAVDFCYSQAGILTDSLSRTLACTIARISDRNRNPDNAPADEVEAQLLVAYSRGQLQTDPVIVRQSRPVFYRPIKVGMPTCLSCHGQPGTDIDDGTLEALQMKYPSDKATGYALGEFRGLWKITFDE